MFNKIIDDSEALEVSFYMFGVMPSCLKHITRDELIYLNKVSCGFIGSYPWLGKISLVLYEGLLLILKEGV